MLKLEANERRDELDEDYTERGSRIHNILQQLEEMKQHIREGETPEELARIAVGAELNIVVADASEVELGLAEIERRRLIQTMERYVDQLRRTTTTPVRGRPRTSSRWSSAATIAASPPGDRPGAATVRLQGKIDRIDLVDTPEGRGFRVIDYKSGAGPSTTEVRKALMLQLPLYAMAVEQIVLADRTSAPRRRLLGAAKDGYKPIAFPEWEAVQAGLESYVVELVDRLRQGIFVVDSQGDGAGLLRIPGDLPDPPGPAGGEAQDRDDPPSGRSRGPESAAE